MMIRRHAMPFGAEVLEAGGTRFRLWAPAAKRVHVRIEAPSGLADAAMKGAGGGWFEAVVEGAGAGARYRFVIDGEDAVPDPASRFQPDDVHGASEVIDPAGYTWRDEAWAGRPWEEAVIYELHVGAFTPEGTFRGAARRLDHLAELGVTAVELMPVADAPGARGWGYDGVYPFAPESAYGRPEDLKALVEAAHALGLMVLLDVVYNHFGPEGNYLHRYAPSFFTDRFATPWGSAIDFGGPASRPVRDFFIHNACYWIEEFHFDGLRLDAVHAIFDSSAPDILEEIAATVRGRAGGGRPIHLVIENDDNAARYLRGAPGERRGAFTAQWNDDVHHALHVIVTGEADGYYVDYADAPLGHLGRSLTEGFAYQGEKSRHRGRARGAPSGDLPVTAFVGFLQNHDQIGNRAFGERILALAPAAAVRAALAVLLLAPAPPLLFMGEEWGCAKPFYYFCDFGPDLAHRVTVGRRAEFAAFKRFADTEERARIPDPNDPATFRASVLDWTEPRRGEHREWLEFYRELLGIRRRDIVPIVAGDSRPRAGYRLLGKHTLFAEWRFAKGAHLTLVANLGGEAAEAPRRPPGRRLFATHPEKERGLVPWSVAWYVAGRRGRS